MKLNLASLFAGVLLATSFTAHSETILVDTFEGGNFLKSNPDGFQWDSTNKTSIVNQAQVVNNGNPVNVPIPSGRDWTPREPEAAGELIGDHTMRFRYSAGNEWTEQRYDLGGAYPEVWVGYWMKVPINYRRGSGTNNKWFNIWMGRSKSTYSADYENANISRIEMQDWAGSNNSMDINIQFRNGTDGKFSNSSRYPNFVTPADAGRWMHVVYHFKASSSNSANDGILRMYRRWHGQQDFELINNLQNLNVGIGSGSQSVGRLGWGAGYIMGYANAPYSSDTEWLMDDFTVSTHSLLVTGDIVSRPSAPTNLAVTVQQ